MPDEPKKIFDLMDTEIEPTDEQLAELMRYVGEAVRARKAAAREKEASVMALNEPPARPYGK